MDGDGAASPDEAAKLKGADALFSDVRVEVVAVGFGKAAVVVALQAFVVFAGPDCEAPGVDANNGNGSGCKEGRNLHDVLIVCFLLI